MQKQQICAKNEGFIFTRKENQWILYNMSFFLKKKIINFYKAEKLTSNFFQMDVKSF